MLRGVEGRIKWFLNHKPKGPGMCAQHSWHALGGDKGDPPAWGCRNANAVYSKVVKSGRFWRTDPPRGALVVWRYGDNGHAAISLGGGKIATTDPTGKPGGTGIEPINYPTKWGATKGKWIWTDEYNGVRFPVDNDAIYVTRDIYVEMLKCGQPASGTSDTIKELQHRLNRIKLKGGSQLHITGVYDAATDREVRLWQEQVCHDAPDPEGQSYLGPKQAKRMFGTDVYIIHK